MRRLLAHWLLALALALAGPGAYAHALEHLGETQHEHSHDGCADGHSDDAPGHACELCAAFSATGALGTAPSLLPLADSGACDRPTVSTGRLTPCEALGRFASRAPPRSH